MSQARRLPCRHVAERFTGGLQPSHEVVERKIVQHDERAGQEHGAVDLEVELHVVPELEDAEVVPGEAAGVRVSTGQTSPCAGGR